MRWTRIICNAIVGLFLGVTVFFGGCPPADASLFLAMTADELIGQSDAVVQGRVIRQQSQWDEQGQLIVTDTTVRVSETIVGQAPTFVTVRTPGGTVGNFRVEAPGFPQLNAGEEVILFLKNDEAIQVSRIVGHQQGHVEVVERRDGVVLAVPRIEDEAGLFTPSGQFVPAPPSTELSLFKQRVREVATRHGR
jgi:hypothetical protein